MREKNNLKKKYINRLRLALIILGIGIVLTGCESRSETFCTAYEFYQNGQYEEALSLFDTLENYRGSKDLAEECRRELVLLNDDYMFENAYSEDDFEIVYAKDMKRLTPENGEYNLNSYYTFCRNRNFYFMGLSETEGRGRIPLQDDCSFVRADMDVATGEWIETTMDKSPEAFMPEVGSKHNCDFISIIVSDGFVSKICVYSHVDTQAERITPTYCPYEIVVNAENASEYAVITALNANGEVLWVHGPDFMILNCETGETVSLFDHLDFSKFPDANSEEFFWPSEMALNDDGVIRITFDSNDTSVCVNERNGAVEEIISN